MVPTWLRSALLAGAPQADRLKHFLHLALCECLAAGQLLPQTLGTAAAAGLSGVPTEQGVRTGAPTVVPMIVRGHIPHFEVSGVDQIFRLNLARGVDKLIGDRIEIVVSEGLDHGIHAAVTADAVVEEGAAVGAGTAAHVLPDAIRAAA